MQGNIEQIKHLDTQFQNSQGIVTHHIYDCRNQKTITIDESEQYRHHSITRKRDAQLSCQTSSGNSVSVPNCFLCFLEPFCFCQSSTTAIRHIYTQYQVSVLYDPACSLTTKTAETMQHEEVAGAAPNGIVGTLRTPYLDGRSACQHNVWSVWTDPFCSLQLLSHNSYSYLLPKNR